MVRRLAWISAILATGAGLAGATIANAASSSGDNPTLRGNTKVACGMVAGMGMVPPAGARQIAAADKKAHLYTVRVPRGTIPPGLPKIAPGGVAGTGKAMILPAGVGRIATADKGAHLYTVRVPRGAIPPGLTKIAARNGSGTCKVTITAPQDQSRGSS
jgi:hypothetical protein